MLSRLQAEASRKKSKAGPTEAWAPVGKRFITYLTDAIKDAQIRRRLTSRGFFMLALMLGPSGIGVAWVRRVSAMRGPP